MRYLLGFSSSQSSFCISCSLTHTVFSHSQPKHFLFSHSQPHLHESILASILNIVPPPSFTTHHLQLSPLTAQFSIHAPLSVSAASTPQLIFQRFVARRYFPLTHSPLIPFRYVFNHRSPPRFLYTVEYEVFRMMLGKAP